MVQEVSWQSTFWGLLTVSLNTMIQPSGEVLGFPTAHGFALRSSPLICPCDTIHMIAKFPSWTFSVKSPRHAARKIVQDRFRYMGPDTGSFAQFRENIITRLLLFVLSSLTGMIKTYGMQNTAWTKAWASMFWASFLVMEFLFIITTGKDRWKLLSLPEERPRSEDYYDPYVGMIGYATAVVCILPSVYVVSGDKQNHILSLVIFVISPPFLLLPLLLSARTPWVKHVLEAVFVLTNLFGGLFYYSVLWDATGTVKPAWTEELG